MPKRVRRRSRTLRQHGGGGPSVHLVVARYMEPVDWLAALPRDLVKDITMYNKGDPIESVPNGVIVRTLPNLGYEGHTYLTFITENYNNLPDYTIFVPGSTWKAAHKLKAFLQLLIEFRKQPRSLIRGFFPPQDLEFLKSFTLDSYVVSNTDNRVANPTSEVVPAEDRPLGVWLSKRMPGQEIEIESYNGVFIVSREDLRKSPKLFYEGLLQELQVPNPEVIHYMERVWGHLLHIPRSGWIKHT